MKRCGFILLGLPLVLLSGDASFDPRVAYAGDGPQTQGHGAIAEQAAALIRPSPGSAIKVNRTVHADVVAIDQPFVINRLGASQPAGMIFVLKNDLVAKASDKPLDHNNFKLRSGKRPRPLVLRMNVGDMLEIHFENWLQGIPASGKLNDTQKLATSTPFQQLTRYAGIHVNGLELVPEKVAEAEGIKSDGSGWERTLSGLLPPRSEAKDPKDESLDYRLYARQSGTFLLTSGADTTVHQLDAGLFGAVNVQPRGAEWYRSQTTHAEIQAATLQEGDLRSHEQALGPYQPPPRLTPDQEMLDSDREVTAPAKGESLRSLRTAAPGSRAQVVANVIIRGEGTRNGGRIYSKTGQPLINYFSVFTEDDRAACPTAIPGKPILNMLGVELGEDAKEAKFKIEDEQKARFEAKRLDEGVITFYLRGLFKSPPLNIELEADASVARSAYVNKDSWVVTNPGTTAMNTGTKVVAGKTYLVQELHDADHTLSIQECELHLVYSDLTAAITGPNAGNFPYSEDSPDFFTNPASPDRRQPYREFTIIYHQGGNVVQAFRPWSNNNLFNMINAGMDQFGINYGFAAIGPEIVANRLGVGPMGNSQQPIGASGPDAAPKANQPNDAVDLKYEEFFLSSWAVGDPAMVVDVPSNAPNQMVSDPGDKEGEKIIGQVQNNPIQFNDFKELSGARPTKVVLPDDPSNVYHSYMRDHVKFRILHAGPGPAHVHHLHAHQWLHSPNSPKRPTSTASSSSRARPTRWRSPTTAAATAT